MYEQAAERRVLDEVAGERDKGSTWIGVAGVLSAGRPADCSRTGGALDRPQALLRTNVAMTVTIDTTGTDLILCPRPPCSPSTRKRS